MPRKKKAEVEVVEEVVKKVRADGMSVLRGIKEVLADEEETGELVEAMKALEVLAFHLAKHYSKVR